jgi:hypothetical protein
LDPEKSGEWHPEFLLEDQDGKIVKPIPKAEIGCALSSNVI